jgi:hypothetical protein
LETKRQRYPGTTCDVEAADDGVSAQLDRSKINPNALAARHHVDIAPDQLLPELIVIDSVEDLRGAQGGRKSRKEM